MIKLEDISLSFGSQVIFDNQTCNILPGQKIGLVGRNGAGKSTLLKVIAGQQHLDDGKVYIPKNFKIAYMSQDMTLISARSVMTEAVCANEELGKLIDEYSLLDAILHKTGENNFESINNNFVSRELENLSREQLLERYAHVYSELCEIDYENKCIQAKKILTGLGFLQEQFDAPVSKLSVGWKMRLVLAKLLLESADFYLFDEPTNHLDIVAKDWFLDFLKNAKFGFILVSHDQYFLENTCDYICDVSMGKLIFYTGNYSKYIVQKEENKALLEKKYEEQQKLIKKKMEVIDRFRYKASKAKMAQSMIKSLEKIEKIELEPELESIGFRLAPPVQSGKVVLTVKDLAFSFGDKKIFSNVSFEINRGNKVAIVAPNGTGKSTLLNVIMGKLNAQKGSIEFGHNVKAVFFEQDQNKSLDAKSTVLDEAVSVCSTEEQRLKVRGLLGAFLFSGDDVNKKIGVLSGGEKNRVAMVRVLLQGGNFLILDEPTNHLDIQSKNILLDVLKKYEGTILFVSHDRIFLNSLATDILELSHERIFAYKGNYDEYLYHRKYLEQEQKGDKASSKNAQKAVSPLNQEKNIALNNTEVKNVTGKSAKETSQKEVQKDSANNYEKNKEIKKLEAAIDKLEREIKELLVKFEKFSYGTKEYFAAQDSLKELQAKLSQKTLAWEELLG